MENKSEELMTEQQFIAKFKEVGFELYKTEGLKEQLVENMPDGMELLTAYSNFLADHGYIDSDWWSEHPKAIEQFLKTIK